MTNITDLTKNPPRSTRTRLGGYALLPRMLDKCRAEIAGKSGEYHFNCPLDQRILEFLGIDAEALKAEVATGKGDGDLLTWIKAHQKNKHTPAEIEAFSEIAAKRTPDADSQEFFNEILKNAGPKRTDMPLAASRQIRISAPSRVPMMKSLPPTTAGRNNPAQPGCSSRSSSGHRPAISLEQAGFFGDVVTIRTAELRPSRRRGLSA